MILPLADALQNCLQNLTSRIAGVDNEQMTGRVMGMGAMLGFGIGAIKDSNNNNSSSGFKGFVSRAKAVINPNMNLSDEKDYNGNINPIREVLTKEKNTFTNATDNSKIAHEKVSNNSTVKSVVGTVVKTGFNATKAYLDIGSKMVEGDFNKSAYTYKRTKNTKKKSNFQSAEYINRISNNSNDVQKLGDDDEFRKKD